MTLEVRMSYHMRRVADKFNKRQEAMVLLSHAGASNEQIAEKLRLTAEELGEEWSQLEALLSSTSQERSVEIVMRRLLEKARAALTAEDARFALIVGMPKGRAVLTLDATGFITAASRNAEDLLGIPCEMLLGRPVDLLLDARAEGVDQSSEEMLRAGYGEAVSSERLHRRTDGETFLAHHCVLALIGPSGHTTGFLRVITDLEWRRVHELRVEELEASISVLVKPASPQPS